MRMAVHWWVVLGALTPAMACVHPGQYKKDLAATQAQIAQERSERMAGDSATNGQVASVRADLAALRGSLDSMRSDFNAKITQVAEGMKFDMPVTFAFNDATIRDDDHAALDRFAGVVRKYYGGSKLTVEGFADPAGTRHYNVVLSQRRADAVRDYLAQRGLDVAMIKTVGYGKTRLLNPKASKDAPGAEDNRRVVFVIETKSDGQMQQQPGKTTANASDLQVRQGR